jgi:hypothetical protein
MKDKTCSMKDTPTMSKISRTITLHVPSNIIYRALKDARLEKLFPEFCIGVTRKIVLDKANKGLSFRTTIQGSQIEKHLV